MDGRPGPACVQWVFGSVVNGQHTERDKISAIIVSGVVSTT